MTNAFHLSIQKAEAGESELNSKPASTMEFQDSRATQRYRVSNKQTTLLFLETCYNLLLLIKAQVPKTPRDIIIKEMMGKC